MTKYNEETDDEVKEKECDEQDQVGLKKKEINDSNKVHRANRATTMPAKPSVDAPNCMLLDAAPGEAGTEELEASALTADWLAETLAEMLAETPDAALATDATTADKED